MKSYFSIALILSLFIVALITNGCEEEEVIGYNCVNSSCVSSENAQYVSIEDCLLACSNNGGGNNTTTWNCLNYSCVESTQNIGLYTSLADCQTACTSGNGGSGGSGSGGSGSGSVSSYNCNNGNCIDPGDGSGAYTNLSSCLSNCGNISDCDDNYTINNTTTFELGEGPSEIVNFAEQKKKRLNELTLDELKNIEPKLTFEVLKVFDLKNSVKSKKSYGGTSFENIKRMILRYKRGK